MSLTDIAKRLAHATFESIDLDVRWRHHSDPFWVQSVLVKNENPVIFDIGAHVGSVTARYRKIFPGGTIHVFEPFRESFQALKERFGSCPAVRLNETAITDSVGRTIFNANVSSKTNSILKSDPRVSESWVGPFHDTTSTIEVPTTTIDAYCEANAIDRIDILKLDVQGAELQALNGAKSTLQRHCARQIYMEVLIAPTYVSQPRFEDYLQFLRSVGYEVLDIFNPLRRDLRLLQLDVIFVPNVRTTRPATLKAADQSLI
jgi:FkbM family methyltransferase